jgi:dihydroorotase
MFLTAALEGKISLERVVEAASTAPARIFGLKQKGDVKLGLDADLVLVDLEREYEIRDADVLSLVGWSPYAGRRFRGKTARTIVRGKTVYADDKVIGQRGFGLQSVAAPGARRFATAAE